MDTLPHSPESPDPELFDALPGVFRELAESFPAADLLRLSEAYGGTRVYVPPTFDKARHLAERLGEDLARRLVRLCKGEELAVPLCLSFRRLLRIRQAWEMKEQGKSTGEIALAFKTTDMTVSRWLKQERERRANLPNHPTR